MHLPVRCRHSGGMGFHHRIDPEPANQTAGHFHPPSCIWCRKGRGQQRLHTPYISECRRHQIHWLPWWSWCLVGCRDRELISNSRTSPVVHCHAVGRNPNDSSPLVSRCSEPYHLQIRLLGLEILKMKRQILKNLKKNLLKNQKLQYPLLHNQEWCQRDCSASPRSEAISDRRSFLSYQRPTGSLREYSGHRACHKPLLPLLLLSIILFKFRK